jgi:hypothetical protein
MFQLQLFFWLHCDQWHHVVALSRHKFVTGATLLQPPCKEVMHKIFMVIRAVESVFW